MKAGISFAFDFILKQVQENSIDQICFIVFFQDNSASLAAEYTGRFIMYSGITNIYYRKTVGHVFTKHVQIEGRTQFFPPSNASVCSEKMAAPREKSFCVLEYHTSKSLVTVQRAFRAKYAKDPPTVKTIRAWYKQVTETGCLCKQKSSGRRLTAEDNVERVLASFVHSPKKSTGTAAHIEHL